MGNGEDSMDFNVSVAEKIEPSHKTRKGSDCEREVDRVRMLNTQ